MGGCLLDLVQPSPPTLSNEQPQKEELTFRASTPIALHGSFIASCDYSASASLDFAICTRLARSQYLLSANLALFVSCRGAKHGF
jgi:hypothetical protein